MKYLRLVVLKEWKMLTCFYPIVNRMGLLDVEYMRRIYAGFR